MKRAIPPLLLMCVAVAGFIGASLMDARDNLPETLAKGIGMISMLVLALSLAHDARASGERGEG